MIFSTNFFCQSLFITTSISKESEKLPLKANIFKQNNYICPDNLKRLNAKYRQIGVKS